MKTWLLSLFIFMFCSAKAQTNEQFDELGRLIFKEFTDTSYNEESEFIRISNYQKLIDRQDISPYQKEKAKVKLNEDYNDLYLKYRNAYGQIKDSYTIDAKQGATFEYMDTRFEPMDGTKDAYHVKTQFIYRNGKVRTQVSFQYDVAWFFDFFQLMSPISEDF